MEYYVEKWGDSLRSMPDGRGNNHKGNNIAKSCTYVCINSVKGNVSKVIGRIKGNRTLMIFDRHPVYREKHNRHFGIRGYHCETAGNVNEEIIKRDIGNYSRIFKKYTKKC